MTKGEKEILEKQGRNIEKVLDILRGDEFGNDPGLIARQKQDEANQDRIFKSLDAITKLQEQQIKVNENIEVRMKSVEEFVSFFKALSLIRRKSIIFIGAFISGIGYLVMNLNQIWDFFFTKR